MLSKKLEIEYMKKYDKKGWIKKNNSKKIMRYLKLINKVCGNGRYVCVPVHFYLYALI